MTVGFWSIHITMTICKVRNIQHMLVDNDKEEAYGN